MKLRLAANALRLRILRSELSLLEQRETLYETVRLASGTFGVIVYSLRVADGNYAEPLQISCDRGSIDVALSLHSFQTWLQPDEVGVYASVETGQAVPLQVVLEKDFACLDRSDADNSDTFAHPLVGAVC